MTIRKATIKDLGKISELNLKLFQFERQFSDSCSLDWTFSQIGQTYFTNRITQENGIVFVAENNVHTIGYLCGYVFDFKARQPSSMAEIDNMYVEDKFRSQGIGGQLIKAFESEAKKRGVARLKVGAIFQNQQAVDFYEKSGFHSHEIMLEKDLN
ncbi:MAG: hypothetical protein ACD_83C00042G0002 [uncultured bacterium]|nr:MAG: hypothetical protein ACD_83C00042G0002 [uncultured bacterium]